MTKTYDTACTAKNTKLLYGVGFNSGGKYKTKKNGKRVKAYRVWRDMIRRCSCPTTQSKQPTYIGCSVDSEWHDYQDFAEWHDQHEYSRLDYALDKDLLVHGNKIYSSKTCCFVPIQLNNLLTNHAAARGRLPQGVTRATRSHSYSAAISIDGKMRHIGCFSCPIEAHLAYKQVKEDYVKEKAIEWRDRIAPNVFEALMRWQLK